MLYVAIAIVIAVIVLGVSRALWPIDDPVIEIIRAILVCVGSAGWPIFLPIIVCVAVVWLSSTRITRYVQKKFDIR